MSRPPDPLRIERECPGWFAWLDLGGWHARHLNEPKGAGPRVSAATQDGLIAAIRTARKTPLLPRRVPAPPSSGQVVSWTPATRETLARVRAALRRI